MEAEDRVEAGSGVEAGPLLLEQRQAGRAPAPSDAPSARRDGVGRRAAHELGPAPRGARWPGGRWLRRALLVAAIVSTLGWYARYAEAMVSRLSMNDFGRFYYSTRLFLQGEDMYGPSPATLIRVADDVHLQLWNLNPPHFHLLLLPLAGLPPVVALLVWSLASLAALALSLRLIARELRLRLTPDRALVGLVVVLAFAGTGGTILSGQLTFLLLLPVTLAWREARRGRWARAGLWLGLAMAVKSFLLVFVPYLLVRALARRGGSSSPFDPRFVWLLRAGRSPARSSQTSRGSRAGGCPNGARGGERDALLVALAAVGASFGVGLLVFGVEAHRSWLRALASSEWPWPVMNASILGFLARVLTDNPLYDPLVALPGLVTPLWLIAAGLVGLASLWATRSADGAAGVDHAFALLLVAAVLASPLGWVYYLWLPAGPVLGVAMAARSRLARGEGPRRGISLPRAALLGLATLCAVYPLVTLAQTLRPGSWAGALPGSAYFVVALVLWVELWRARPAAVAGDGEDE